MNDLKRGFGERFRSRRRTKFRLRRNGPSWTEKSSGRVTREQSVFLSWDPLTDHIRQSWPTTFESVEQEVPDRHVLRGFTAVVDNAVSLLSENDEHRLAEKLAKMEDTEIIWPVVERMLRGEIATPVTATLAAAVLANLYQSDKARARILIYRLLNSQSHEDIDLAIRIINETEDSVFLDSLDKVLQRPGLPPWLRTTVEDAAAGLRDAA